MPVLAGDKVGAQDLINREFIFHNEDDLVEKIGHFCENRGTLIAENAHIIGEKIYPFQMDDYRLYQLYR